MASGDVQQQLSRMKIQSGPPRTGDPSKLPKWSPGQRAEAQLAMQTNSYGVYPSRTAMPMFRYDVRILEEYPSPKGSSEKKLKEVTKQTRNDYLSIARKNKCVGVYSLLMRREAAFFGPMKQYVYDRASILYAIRQLNIGENETKTFFVMPNEVEGGLIPEDCVRVHVNIKRCVEDFELNTHDLKKAFSLDSAGSGNFAIVQFYQLLLSQEAFFNTGEFVSYGTGDCYLMDPTRHGFRNEDMCPLNEGKYCGIGASKGVKIIENEKKLMVSLMVDIKKAAFHIELQKLDEKVSLILHLRDVPSSIDDRQLRALNRFLKGLYVKAVYGKGRTFEIYQLSKDTAGSFKFKKDNKMVGLLEYFNKQYNLQIRSPQLPLVVEKTPKGFNYYPMEFLVVCENQRVTQTQQSTDQTRAMIKACALLPIWRLRQTQNMVSAMKLDRGGQNNAWLRDLGVNISSQTLAVKGRVLPRPKVVYQSSEIAVNNDATWMMPNTAFFFVPATLQKWWLIAICAQGDRFGTRELNNYSNAFMSRCRQHGMKVTQPAKCVCEKFSVNLLDNIFRSAKAEKVQFLHFITSDAIKFHDRLKLLENETQIVTQDLKGTTASKAPSRGQTMDNIVMKTNLKLGGLNFHLKLESDEANKWLLNETRLIIGIDLSFGTKKKSDGFVGAPTVVGYAFNGSRDPLQFTGGYRYARSDMEELEEGDVTITGLVKEALTAKKGDLAKPPVRHIIVLRDGVSEGQYKYLVDREVVQIKNACSVFDLPGNLYRPHITVLVATKQHNMRLYKREIPQQAKCPEQNIPPGTVVDTDIVSPIINEFYLNSHKTIQGSAKTPRYNVVFDTARMQYDELQGIVYALACNLQIVSQACSLPAPIMMATHYARRGRNNYNARYGESDLSADPKGTDLVKLNKELTYIDRALQKIRYNA